jgi:hypothetical protein
MRGKGINYDTGFPGGETSLEHFDTALPVNGAIQPA